MANSMKARKPVSAKTKGAVCLVLLLALTVFVSCLAVGGMKLDAEGVNVLLPWVPVSSQNWPTSLPLARSLGGGHYAEYTVTPAEEGADLQAEAQAVAKVFEARLAPGQLSNMEKMDIAISVKEGGIVRIEASGHDHEALESLLSMATIPGQFQFQNDEGQTVLTEKDIAKVTVGYDERSATSLRLNLEVKKESLAALEGLSKVSMISDGASVTTAALVKDGVISFTTTNSGVANHVYYLIQTGSFSASLAQTGEGELENGGAGTLRILLIVAAVVLLAALVYLIAVGRMTGVAAIWTVWCAVMLEMFFFATLVLNAMTVVLFVALVIGFLLAIYTAALRTKAIRMKRVEGNTPKTAAKLGYRVAAKQVWLAHGALLVLSLVLMIFPFAKAVGYTLCAGVVASAIAAPLMRLFQGCLNTMAAKSK